MYKELDSVHCRQIANRFYDAGHYNEAYLFYRRGARHCVPAVVLTQECEERMREIVSESEQESFSLAVLFQALGTDGIQSDQNWTQSIRHSPLFDFQLLPLILSFVRQYPSLNELNYCDPEEESVWDGPHGDCVLEMFH